MDTTVENAPKRLGISLSLKRRRMLIYRSTLKEIGEPGFIRLLVNRRQKRVAVQCCEEIDKDSYRIPPYDSWDQFEITSLKFINMIYKMGGWNMNKTYRIFGYPVSDYRLVLFCLKDAQEIADAEFESSQTVMALPPKGKK